jgi:hypothetical protein
VLAQCVEFFANPERENDSYKRLWHEVEQIDAHRRLPWLVWNAFLAQLWWGSPSEIADSGKKALALLETIDSIENSALATVASAIAHACVRAENVSQADKLVAQLGYLSNGSKQQAIADLFQGHAVEGLPQPPPDAVPEVIQACHLLQAAVAFVAGMQDQGYKAVLDAMKCQVQDTTNIVNFIRFLPALCMHSTSGVSVPQPLIEAIRKISGVDGERATSVARCAAAIGEVECACRLWEQVLAKQPNSPLNHEYAEFLCHLAIVAYNSGNCHETVEKLRVAATLGGKQHERD